MEKHFDFNSLLVAYRTLWHNRLLSAEDEPEMVLKEAIARELKDENAHPRVRKSPDEKFYLAEKRVMESSLSERDKHSLIQIHIEEMQKLK
ncbi:hypothetical protein BGM26_07960 [Bacillus sp. FJAT-29790]|uniref:hypothetical protein n=1 Tax=Bacillus sp. FJAT-29790 TaxID=1895002 RepID=UPI001C239AAA|nr:hypothetical protein [Bacillus sp. FJAT-29790]MBU8878918.1 hypothetical protein [Bacillus sp. FJAT-29790]